MTVTEDRIESLERQVRRQRRWNLGLVALVVVGGLMAATSAQQVPDYIAAKGILIKDEQGRLAVAIGADQDGGWIRAFGADRMKAMIDLRGQKAGGSLQVLDTEGRIRHWMDCGEKMVSYVITDKAERPVVSLAATRLGGMILTHDEKGKGSGQLP